MNKILTTTFASITLICTLPALAKEPKIDSNTSGVSGAVVNNAAAAAIGSGAKEPLTISGSSSQLVITGSNGTSCKIPLNNGKINGVSCK
ncbi:hypothetical protein ACKLNO_07630 [Neisseriaceae bacterium B1]